VNHGICSPIEAKDAATCVFGRNEVARSCDQHTSSDDNTDTSENYHICGCINVGLLPAVASSSKVHLKIILKISILAQTLDGYSERIERPPIRAS